MLINWLQTDPIISKYIQAACAENNIEFIISDEIDRKDILIIKVDAFYNEEIKNPEDPSPDCLIIQRCQNHFDIYIVELRNVKKSKGFQTLNIAGKFITCLDDFMMSRFGNYFYNEAIHINKLKLYFISDPYGFKVNPEKQSSLRGHKFDLLNSIRIPRFFGKYLFIEPHIPNPTLLKCA